MLIDVSAGPMKDRFAYAEPQHGSGADRQLRAGCGAASHASACSNVTEASKQSSGIFYQVANTGARQRTSWGKMRKPMRGAGASANWRGLRICTRSETIPMHRFRRTPGQWGDGAPAPRKRRDTISARGAPPAHPACAKLHAGFCPSGVMASAH